MRVVIRGSMLLCICLLMISIHAGGILAARKVTVAVVRDGPETGTPGEELVKAELDRIIGSEVDVMFKMDKAFDAGWDPARMRLVVQNALNDPEVDIVLITGAITSQAAASADFELSKPVVSGFAQPANMIGIPISGEDRSLKKNMAVIIIPKQIDNDIGAFKAVLPFRRIHLIVDQNYLEQIDFYQTAQQDYGRAFDVEVILVPLTDNVSATLAVMDETAEAVLVGRSPRLPVASREELFRELTARRLPTFSILGHPDIEIGALVSMLPDISIEIARRTALNISQIIRGVPANELPVLFTVQPQLLINGRTAAAIGYKPNFEARIYATILHETALESGALPLSFVQAMRLAEDGNVALTIRDAQVEGSRRDVQVTRSSLLPQIYGGAAYQHLQPRVQQEFIPEYQSLAGVTLSQMIYDDRVVSDYRSTKRIHESSQYERAAGRMDVVSEGGRFFLRYVLARLLYKVELDNLRLTEENLDISKLRLEVGYSGKDEVFRWEAQLAQGRSSLLKRYAEVESARIAFNQILGIDQETKWLPEEVEIDPEVFSFLDGRVDFVFRNESVFNGFREFMVVFAFENAPELKSLGKVIESQEIQLGERRRSFILPKFSLNLSYDYQFSREPELVNGKKDDYRVELAASIPIFNGGRRFYDMRRVQVEIETLQREEQLTYEIVEKRTRTSLSRIENSFPGIKLSFIAAENAGKNLDVVQDKYAMGIVNITDLLEAQNMAFVADQNSAISIYAYYYDLVEFQRGIGWFEDEKSDEEKDALFSKIEAAVLPE